MLLEVREVEPLQVRKEIVAEVVLDVARRADDDPPHDEAEEAADRGQAQDDATA